MVEMMSNTSIVIPVYNDSQGIRDTLDSILENTKGDPEIIVVDNNSTDETPRMIRQYADCHNHIHLYFERDVQSSYAARNTGIEYATGDVIVLLDADQTVTESWLSDGLEQRRKRGAHYFAPNVQLTLPKDVNITGRYNYLTGFPIEEFIQNQRFAPTACLFVTRSLINDVGKFDERLISGGDKEFGNRVANAGYELHYAPSIVVYHPVRNSLNSLVKRNVRIGRGHCQLQQYYPDRYGRVGVPPRPSGIHGDQLENKRENKDNNHDRRSRSPRATTESTQGLERVLLSVIAILMTITRGLGYYMECTEIVVSRLRGE